MHLNVRPAAVQSLLQLHILTKLLQLHILTKLLQLHILTNHPTPDLAQCVRLNMHALGNYDTEHEHARSDTDHSNS